MKIVEQWNDQDSEYIRLKVIEHNLRCLGPRQITPTKKQSYIIRDEHDKIVGGITGTMYWQHLYIDFLWVDESLRGQDYGSQLIDSMEQYARDEQCRLIVVDTFSFQAPAFYEKKGFVQVGVIEDFPASHAKYFYEKRLCQQE
ncbi:acetyltransferase [Fictibacillus macauensis ZFHKF-1]|uniref:Acetyltransferase n=1 Tax=Fictibacillus macauensis ZFHKF-1 TaxID=1196324 RepID=I8AK41_9BACL|nr:GNAT family N-acetyltransferase [Fictibacillus macauensis]EIT86192.1 acetyltransferase [Fictibacillus macauensis ZFHKF-1]